MIPRLLNLYDERGEGGDFVQASDSGLIAAIICFAAWASLILVWPLLNVIRRRCKSPGTDGQSDEVD